MKKILSILMASAMLAVPATMAASADNNCKIKDILSNITPYINNDSTCKNGSCDILDILGVKIDISNISEKITQNTKGQGLIDLITNGMTAQKGNEKTEDADKQESIPQEDEVQSGDFQNEAQRVIELVNSYRAQNGLSPVTYDASTTCAAQKRAQEIIKVFSHTRPDGTRCFTALDECGAKYSGAGENIAMGQTSADEVMTDWMNSQGHRENILDGNFTKIGVGVVKGADGRLYWTQMFIY